ISMPLITNTSRPDKPRSRFGSSSALIPFTKISGSRAVVPIHFFNWEESSGESLNTPMSTSISERSFPRSRSRATTPSSVRKTTSVSGDANAGDNKRDTSLEVPPANFTRSTAWSRWMISGLRAISSPSTAAPELVILTRTGTQSPFISPSKPGYTSSLIGPGDPSTICGNPRKRTNNTKSPFQKRACMLLFKTGSSPLNHISFSQPIDDPCFNTGSFPPQKLPGRTEQLLQGQTKSFSVQGTDQIPDRVRLRLGIGIPVDLPHFPPGMSDQRHPVAKAQQSLRPVVPADSAQLDSSVGEIRIHHVDHHIVDANISRLDPSGHPPRLFAVLRPDAAVQTVGGVIGQPDRLLLRVKGHDRQHRTEGLLGHD